MPISQGHVGGVIGDKTRQRCERNFVLSRPTFQFETVQSQI